MGESEVNGAGDGDYRDNIGRCRRRGDSLSDQLHKLVLVLLVPHSRLSLNIEQPEEEHDRLRGLRGTYGQLEGMLIHLKAKWDPRADRSRWRYSRCLGQARLNHTDEPGGNVPNSVGVLTTFHN